MLKHGVVPWSGVVSGVTFWSMIGLVKAISPMK